MFKTPVTTDSFFAEVLAANLYLKLIDQINKDFNLANERTNLPSSTTPYDLKIFLQNKVHKLIIHKFDSYLNLLYIIDVPENTINSFNDIDIEALSAEVAFLILKREWQKVWFRNRF